MSGHDSARAELIRDIDSFRDDPLGYVLYAFPWGDPDGPLAVHSLRRWQREYLAGIGEQLRAGAVEAGEVIRRAVASGHGVGKSALVAMLCKWAMDTREDTRGVVTANTETQLRTKTWPELAKWHRMSITRDWATLTGTALISNAPGHDKTWRIDAVPWSEHNLDAFAGLHNEGKRLLLVLDESGGIADRVWEVAAGAMTDKDTEILWCAFGNPTQPTGGFRDCFQSDMWQTMHLDSRTVEGINLVELQKMVDEWGEDSDYVKVRIRGVFPSAASDQFITDADIADSVNRESNPQAYSHAARVIGVDIARHGDDQSCIVRRQGIWMDKPRRLRITDLMALSSEVALQIDNWKPDAVFVDATGIGWGVVDRLRQMGYGRILYPVQTGEKAQSPLEYVDHRAELWCRGRDWIRDGGVLYDDKELHKELRTPEYEFVKNRLRVEGKKSIKARGEPSPDSSDALMLTFHAAIRSNRSPDVPKWQQKLRGLGARQINPMTA